MSFSSTGRLCNVDNFSLAAAAGSPSCALLSFARGAANDHFPPFSKAVQEPRLRGGARAKIRLLSVKTDPQAQQLSETPASLPVRA